MPPPVADRQSSIAKDKLDLEFGATGHRTMSIGVAQLRPDESFDRLCPRVDDALYRAKPLGKNRVEAAN